MSKRTILVKMVVMARLHEPKKMPIWGLAKIPAMPTFELDIKKGYTLRPEYM